MHLSLDLPLTNYDITNATMVLDGLDFIIVDIGCVIMGAKYVPGMLKTSYRRRPARASCLPCSCGMPFIERVVFCGGTCNG